MEFKRERWVIGAITTRRRQAMSLREAHHWLMDVITLHHTRVVKRVDPAADIVEREMVTWLLRIIGRMDRQMRQKHSTFRYFLFMKLGLKRLCTSIMRAI